jgi:hypothetical protein
MKKTPSATRPAPRANHARPSPPALCLLWSILDAHIFKWPELDNAAAEAESLLELIGHNPGLKREVNALADMIAVEARLRALREEAEAAFEA